MLALNCQMCATSVTLSYFHVHTAINILRCFGHPREHMQLWACFNTEPNRLYRRLRLFPSKLQEYTPPPFSRLSTQYHIDPLLTCLLSLDTSRTSLRLQWSTKFGNRDTAHGRYEYSYHLANSRENWAQKKNRSQVPGRFLRIPETRLGLYMPKVGVATTKFSVALRAPVAELPLSKFLNPPLQWLSWRTVVRHM